MIAIDNLCYFHLHYLIEFVGVEFKDKRHGFILKPFTHFNKKTGIVKTLIVLTSRQLL